MNAQLTAQQPCRGLEPEKIKSFERAFSEGSFGNVLICECGSTYYDVHNQNYTWDEGEIEALEKSPTAKAVQHAIGVISFEGRRYADACDCWHSRAANIMRFIDGHAHEVAKYLTEEKKRKQAEAENAPEVGQ